MQARVKQTSRYGVITAFTGREFVRHEWREVPAGCEAEAGRNPFLETRAGSGVSKAAGKKQADFTKEAKAKAKAEAKAKPAPNVKVSEGRGLFGRRVSKPAPATDNAGQGEGETTDDQGGDSNKKGE